MVLSVLSAAASGAPSADAEFLTAGFTAGDSGVSSGDDGVGAGFSGWEERGVSSLFGVVHVEGLTLGVPGASRTDDELFSTNPIVSSAKVHFIRADFGVSGRSANSLFQLTRKDAIHDARAENRQT